MPATRLSDSPVSARRFDVVGCDAEPGKSHFVGHVGLFAKDQAALVSGAEIELAHMGPPVERAGGPYACHLHGNAELSDAERLQASVFIDGVEQEFLAQGKRHPESQYFIHPAVCPRLARDGAVRYVRYSCSGFVVAAYRFFGVNLVDDAHELPPISLDVLCRGYPAWANDLRLPKKRELYGLAGAGDWPVLLPGYLFHALSRTAENVRAQPYRPQSGDEGFPNDSSK